MVFLIKKWILLHCPNCMFQKIYKKALDKREYLDTLLVERWISKTKILKKGVCCLNEKDAAGFLDISEGNFPYNYFNICYLNNMMANIVYALARNMIPVINNIWDDFFEPLGVVETSDVHVEKCLYKYAPYTPVWSDAYSTQKIFLWGTIFEQFCKYNEKTIAYLENEEKQVLRGKRNVLGVLIRGTDYISTKPEGHPRQPSVAEIIQTVREKEQEWKFEWIYLATEEKKVVKQMQEAFPNKILLNQSSYYDEFFDKGAVELIGQVQFNRENDDYYKGVEYLSSLNLLSKCDFIIAGNCGGTIAALYMNKNQYKEKNIFDRGYYGQNEK